MALVFHFRLCGHVEEVSCHGRVTTCVWTLMVKALTLALPIDASVS